jgi:glycosyltransferase involved in cell wall biosynthesis
MKVLFISAAFPPMRAGEADHALQLCLRLAERGETLHVLTTKGSLDGRRFPFTVHPLMKDWSWTEVLRLARFVKRCRPDAITLLYSGWIYNDHPMITFAPTVAKWLCPSVPFVTMLAIEEGSNWRSLPSRAIRKAVQFWAGSKTVDYVFGTLLRDSDSVIAWSEHHLARFSERSPAISRKGLVIPPPPLMRMCSEDNGVTRKRGRAQLNVKDNEFLLAFFGYIDRNKGIETLFKAIQLVNGNGYNVRLVMIGGGRGLAQTSSNQRARTVLAYEQEMLRYPEQLGIASKVTWLNGYDSDSHEGSLYLHAADACVLPFDQGVTLNRSSFAAAAAHGLPIISTRGEKLESAFKDQENVFLCPPRDAQALAMAIQSLMRDPALEQQLRKGAAQLADEWFSWERAIDRTIQTFRMRPPSRMDVLSGNERAQ